MREGSLRYILLFLIAIGLVIFVAVLIVRGITATTDSDNSATDAQSLTSLVDEGASVRLTVQGSIVADEEFHSIVIEVGAGRTRLETQTGYQGLVNDRKDFSNNTVAYETFLRALELSGYTLSTDAKVTDDYTAQCPMGQRYIFDVVKDGEVAQRYWATSCGAKRVKDQTFPGTTSQVLSLFRAQVPNYTTLVRGVSL